MKFFGGKTTGSASARRLALLALNVVVLLSLLGPSAVLAIAPWESGPDWWYYYFPQILQPEADKELFYGNLARHRVTKYSKTSEEELPQPETEEVVTASAPENAPEAPPPDAELPPASELPFSPAFPSDPQRARDGEGLSRQFVTRQGDQLFLDGEPYVFVGTNVSYLLEDYFPEAEMDKVVSYLASAGVTALRVWLYPQHNLDRAERLWDLGQKYGIRFVVDLENYYWDKGSWWFDNSEPLRERYMPHVRATVSRFADRPEILMWELMNEPNCSGDAFGNCPDNLVRWTKNVSEEIKALDPNHLISVGVIRIDPNVETYRRLHALDTVDVVSVHKDANVWLDGEIRIARELNKPVLLGEIYSEAYDKSCQQLPNNAVGKRAELIAKDLDRAWAEGVDGYLLWQYGHGTLKLAEQTQYYCGVHDYMRDDPVWKVFQAAPVPRLSISK